VRPLENLFHLIQLEVAERCSIATLLPGIPTRRRLCACVPVAISACRSVCNNEKYEDDLFGAINRQKIR